MHFLKTFLVTSLIVFTSSQAMAATIKIATVVPNGSSWMNEMKAAAKEVKQKTDGRVKIKFYPGGVMGSDKTVLRKMRSGQLHGGAISAGALAHIYNGVQLYSLPFTFNNLAEVRHVRKTFDSVIAEGLANNGFQLLGLSEGGFAYLMSNKALTKAADIQGQKVWVPEGDLIGNEMFSEAGINPIASPISNVYTGLQTGLLDTVTINPSGAIALQWHTKIQHLSDEPLLLIMGMLVVDQKAFKKINANDQVIVKQVVAAAFKRLDFINEKSDISARAALQKNGIQFDKPAGSEWREIARRALINLEKIDAYPADTYQQIEATLEEYRNSQQ
ncbi:MAG: TRAP-type C4-dicarboxylate transport system substrate-binding protein [Oleispira sp.]|jgi:TRAP-type C4-dicarboxylate transport system substrate-binding protein